MPLTLNGFGSAYRGKTDEDEKGFYVTTLFIVAFNMPILPVASFIVRPYGERISTTCIQDQAYDAVQIPLNWRQVISVYLKWYICAALGIGALLLAVSVYDYYRFPESRLKSIWRSSSAVEYCAKQRTCSLLSVAALPNSNHHFPLLPSLSVYPSRKDASRPSASFAVSRLSFHVASL